MPFYNPETRAVKEILSGQIALRSFWGEHIMLVVVDLKAGAVLPRHSHPHEQAGMVLKGELEFDLNGEIRMLHPGDLYIIPGDVPHMVTVGDTPAQVLDIFHPTREDYKYQ